MKILATFQIPVTISLSWPQREIAIRELNLHFLNDPVCNILDPITNKLVAKYPEIEKNNPHFVQSHRNCAMSQEITLTVNLLENGRIELVNKNQ